MNNFFKTIFLLVNLLSTVNSTTNSSFLLPESDLTMVRNSSELTKREFTWTYGGVLVWGVRMGSHGDKFERACTLSFPVEDHYYRKGFLTSYFCTTTNIFLENDLTNEAGKAYPVGRPGLDPERGLDYVFVQIYDDYWSAESSSVAFNENFNRDRYDLLPMIISTQPAFANITVCAYGGLNSEMACGIIVEFGVTIQVPTLWTRTGKDFINFNNVTKIIMDKDYNFGYLGAPIYIPAQIPFSAQLIVAPVGQVVETIAQYNSESQEPNVWYYVPIERILKDSGLSLILGKQ